jgi:hypothetical protein
MIPLVIFLWGFYYSYWRIFPEVLFRRHVHAITATLWILILTIQPWIYNNKSITYHRNIGFVGLFLAGGVVFTSLALLPVNGSFYGFTFSNLLQLIGFSTSVILAMFNSKDYKKTSTMDDFKHFLDSSASHQQINWGHYTRCEWLVR